MIDNECFEKIGFYVSAKGLTKLDTFSNSDPFAAVFCKDKKTGEETRVGLTGLIMDNQNPEWPDQFILNYYFEAVQEITIKVYDRDGNQPLENLTRHDFGGQCTFNLSALMCAKSQKLTLNLTGGRSKGTVSIQAEAVSNTRDLFIADYVGTKLANKEGMFGKSDPFLRLYRLYESGEWGLTHQTPHVMNNLNPHFTRVGIPMVSLCNGDVNRPVKIEIWDYDNDGKHDFMGGFETSVHAMLTSGGTAYDVIEPEIKKKKKSYTNSGTMSIQNAIIEPHPTLTDFIMGGCEISLTVALDFTGSNGPCNDAMSLHYVNPGGHSFNQYEQAILSVGRVLEDYDTDKMYPVYGFGAKIHLPTGGMSPVQHCFPVYGGGLEVQGVQGILSAYRECLNHISFSGPTLFSPLIEASTGIAAGANCSQERQKYTILLIITDGEINDMPQTIDSIVRAASQPMSIIIIGVGSADFSSMKMLDGDGGPLKSQGQSAPRDIVQFVSMREFVSNPMGIAQAVLAEVPGQLLKYMTNKGLRPNSPRS